MLYNYSMKKEIKDKLIEVGSFFICLAVLLAIAYYSGFIKEFSVKDFQNAYEKSINAVTTTTFKNKNKSNLFNTNNSKSKHISTYKDYSTMRIPVAVLRGVASSQSWENVFYSDKKVVFFVYSDSQTDFYNSVSNYLNTKSKKNKYKLVAYTQSSINSIRVGDIGPSKICDSLDECNAVRQKAADYTALSEFIKQCGKYMCIINPQEQKYVKLRNKNSYQAVKMINDLVNW